MFRSIPPGNLRFSLKFATADPVSPSFKRTARGFSLVEIMVVTSIIVLLLGFSTSAFRNVTQGDARERAVVGISSAFEAARQHAVTKSTYTWVAMHSGENRYAKQNVVTVATFASVDGTRGPSVGNPENVRLLAKVETFEGVDLLENLPSGTSTYLPPVASIESPKKSNFPLRSNDIPREYADLEFDWIVMFTPRGEAVIDRGPASGQPGADADSVDLSDTVQLVVISRKGKSSSEQESKSAMTLRLNSLTGQLTVFRPGFGD